MKGPWEPLRGPQTQALNSPADILLYGGAAGGGKTDLLLGAAHTKHSSGIIFRRQYKQLSGIIDRGKEMFGHISKFNGQLQRWQFTTRRGYLELGACQNLGDEEAFQGRPHSFIGFDELPHFTKKQFLYLQTWNRTTILNERCRVIATCNPPGADDDADGGAWILDYWGAWLDPQHPHPAKPGELRWYTTIDGRDIECADGKPFKIKDEWVKPKSRTFIPARVVDNPFLSMTGYASTLQALPEPLRSQMLYGDFNAGRHDHPWQVIPTEWVDIAQRRWREMSEPEGDYDCIGVDVARGGKDKTILSPRKRSYFYKQICYPGSDTPNGPMVAGLVLPHLKPRTKVNIDVIGVGTSPYDNLAQKIGDRACAMNGAEGSIAKDKSGILEFANCRAEWHWRMRETLDPANGFNPAIPDDPELKSDLCAPRWKNTLSGILIEKKEEIQARIGRSPDKGDSLVYANAVKTFEGQGWLDYAADEVDQTQRAKAVQQAEKQKPPVSVARHFNN